MMIYLRPGVLFEAAEHVHYCCCFVSTVLTEVGCGGGNEPSICSAPRPHRTYFEWTLEFCAQYVLRFGSDA